MQHLPHDSNQFVSVGQSWAKMYAGFLVHEEGGMLYGQTRDLFCMSARPLREQGREWASVVIISFAVFFSTSMYDAWLKHGGEI